MNYLICGIQSLKVLMGELFSSETWRSKLENHVASI